MFKQPIINTTTETRKSKDDKAGVVTALTIDFTGATEETVRDLAVAQVKVRAQAHFRKNGIPKQYTLKVAEMATSGVGLSPEQMEAAVLSQFAGNPTALAEFIKRAQLAGNTAKATKQ